MVTSILEAVIGHRFIYRYDNGWMYELYVKNDRTVDYRIHTGMVGGRWVNDQTADIVAVGTEVVKISWTEPTGTSVVVTVAPRSATLHGTIFFPRWVHEHPERTVLHQNDHLELMESYRDAGPVYPLQVVAEGATIFRDDRVGVDDDSVIARAPSELPVDFLTPAGSL